MTELQIYALSSLLVHVVCCYLIIRQQGTIDRITNKMLGIQPTPKVKEIKEDDVSPKEDEPLSWHDN